MPKFKVYSISIVNSFRGFMTIGKEGDLEAFKKMIELKKKFVEKYGIKS